MTEAQIDDLTLKPPTTPLVLYQTPNSAEGRRKQEKYSAFMATYRYEPISIQVTAKNMILIAYRSPGESTHIYENFIGE